MALLVIPGGDEVDCSILMNLIINKYLKADEASEGAIRVEVENGLAVAISNELHQLTFTESLNDLNCNTGTVVSMRIVESTCIDDNSVVILGTLVTMVVLNHQECILRQGYMVNVEVKVFHYSQKF